MAAMEGLYREPVTHTLARVTTGGPGLLVDRGWGPSAYAPIARHTFRSADRDIGFATDLVFAENENAAPTQFQLVAFAEIPLDFERVTPYSPSQEELEEYTGFYTSKELKTANRVILEDGRLYLKYRRSPHTPLQPTLKDQFATNEMRVEFARDSRGRIKGFGIWFDRAWNVRFVRHNP
jgi:hypothetical protein